ncbi:DUF3310 domain-containing protein [Staphylococcus saprophyticus]|uniref:DUF3310 domain-containing protein n=1 Tax=Staphylococcus saprophyticus TaxID=29385 RepID=UPI003BF6C66D
MTRIHMLNKGDIISFEYPIDSGEETTAEVTELHYDVMSATVYDGTETYHIDDSLKITVLTPAEDAKEKHYQSNTEDGIDLIDFWHMQMTAEEFQGAMKSQISKYAVRLGRKDDRIKELKKIEDYARRYREKLEQEAK